MSLLDDPNFVGGDEDDDVANQVRLVHRCSGRPLGLSLGARNDLPDMAIS